MERRGNRGWIAIPDTFGLRATPLYPLPINMKKFRKSTSNISILSSSLGDRNLTKHITVALFQHKKETGASSEVTQGSVGEPFFLYNDIFLFHAGSYNYEV